MKLRLLFVDDEPHILDGLRRALRSMRHKWEFGFAQGGRAALELMQLSHFDIVVSDLRMPLMDGVKFLELVGASHPETLRIVLSGNADDTSMITNLKIAELVLEKPCETACLISAINTLVRERDPRSKRNAGKTAG